MSDRLCVIVGGGAVGVRKARSLIDAGARRVRMVAPIFAQDVPQRAERIQASYQPLHLDGAGIAFAATNVTEVNDAVVRDARTRGVLVSRADGDDEPAGDFVSAAHFQKGPVTVGISAGSAALSVMIREQLAARWEPGWTELADAMMKLRPEIKRRYEEPTRRRIFRDLASDEAMQVISSGGIEGLSQWIAQRYPMGGAERENE